MMKLKSIVRSSTGVLGYLGLHIVNSQILGDETIITALGTTVASAPTILPTVKDFLNETVPGELLEKIKNLKEDFTYGENKELNEAIQKALTHSIDQTAKLSIENFRADELNKKEIRYFGDFIKVSFDDFVINDKDLNKLLHQRGLFLASILDANNYEHPKITCVSLDDFYAFFFNAFLLEFERYFLGELKKDSKAQTAYFVFLLETSARFGQENNTLIKELSTTVEELKEIVVESVGLVRIILRLENQIITILSKQGTYIRLIGEKIDDLKNRIAAFQEPALTLFHSNGKTKPAQRFNFKERYTNFVGREKEMQLLWEFFITEPNQCFKWWIVTGSGGMGKSRLALEFCMEVQRFHHNVGFLAASDITRFDWAHWNPKYPTLIVIDYAITQNDQLIDNLLSTLSNRENGLSKYVRVLLLDRNLRQDWGNKIKALPNVEKTYYNDDISDVLNLPDLSDEFLWGIITQTFEESGKELNVNKVEILAELEKIDSQKRPLFAFFAGVALAAGESIRDWNVSKLLSYHLNRLENNIWSKDYKWSGKWDELGNSYKVILALITLCRGLTASQLQVVNNHKLSCLPDRIDPRLLEVMSSKVRRDEEMIYEGLEPDILGEYFLLTQFEKLSSGEVHLDGEKQLNKIIQIAWDINWKGVGPMSSLIISDFQKEFPEITNKLKIAKPLATSENESWIMWGMFRVLMNVVPTTTTLSLEVEIYKFLIENKHELPQSSIGISVEAFSYSGLVQYYSSVANISKSLKFQEDLDELSNQYLDLTSVQSSVANCKFHLTDAFLRLNKVNDALKINEEFQKLAFSYSDNLEIQECYATSTSNIIRAEGQKGNLQLAIDTYRQLKSVTDSQRNTLSIQLQVASSLVDLLANASGNKHAILDELYQDLQYTASLLPNEFGMQLKHARGLVNVISHSYLAGNMDKAVRYYEILRNVTSCYSDNEEMQSELFKGTFSLINFGKTIDKEISIKTLDERLLSIINIVSDNYDLRISYNLIAPKLIEYFCSESKLDEAYFIYTKLFSFAKLNSEIPELQLAVSRVITILLPYFFKADNGSEVFAFIDEIVQLAFQNPNNIDIQIDCLNIHNVLKEVKFPIDKKYLDEVISQNSQRIVSWYAKNNSLKEAMIYRQSLKNIFGEQKSNLTIALHLALATFNILIRLNVNGRRNKDLERQLKSIFKSFASSTDMIKLKHRFDAFSYQRKHN